MYVVTEEKRKPEISSENNPDMGVWEKNTLMKDMADVSTLLNKTKCWICMHMPTTGSSGLVFAGVPLTRKQIAEHPEFSGTFQNEQGNDVEFGWDSMDSEYQCKAAIFNCTRDCECIQHNLTCTKGDIITGTKTTSCRLTTGKFLNAHMCQVIGMIVTQANATWAVNKSLPLYLGEVWWLCGHNAYPEIPGGWFGTCALGWVSPAVWVNQSLPRGLRLRNKREVPSLDSGLTLGGSWSTQLARGLQPNLGAAMNYRDLHKLNNWTTHMFNFTIKTFKAINQEMQEIRTVVLQNRYALDYLLAAKGGVCALLGAMCCTYIHDNGPNITHTIQHMEDMIKHNPLVTPAEENAMDIWGALWSWLPSGWMAGFVKILILVAGLLVGVCCCLQLGVTHPENLVSAYLFHECPASLQVLFVSLYRFSS
uniref:Envelope glycoprotein n=1 Tax=Naja naja TaxID=35670 RepID=A0A8C6XLL5_NAJNA